MKIQTPSGIPTIVGVPDNRVYEIWVNGQLVWKKGKYIRNKRLKNMMMDQPGI